jgi:hypothetical protein
MAKGKKKGNKRQFTNFELENEEVDEKKAQEALKFAEADEEESEEEVDEGPRKAASATDGLIEVANPNRGGAVSAVSAKKVDLNKKVELSRRQREELQKEEARRRYQKLHAEGKTDEAKADLARLAIIKRKREADRAKREAEEKARKEMGASKKKAKDDEKEVEAVTSKLSSMEIKKMKPPQLKEALKERSLPIQGNKADLVKRLVEYENGR